MTPIDDRELAAREHANFIRAISLIGSTLDGGLIRRSDGVAMIASGLPIILFNQVFVETEDASPAAIAASVETLRQRGSPFVVNLRVGQDDPFIALTAELGLVPLSAHPWMPGMALHPMTRASPASRLDGHEIRRVNDAAGLDDHMRVAAAGFEMGEDLVRRMLSGILEADGIVVYVGYTDGEAVTSGAGVRTGQTIGVYNIATIPSARKRGYGAAMTTRVAADGALDGCDVAILQASDMGRPIYERIGYRTVVEYMGYVVPAPDVGPAPDS